MEPKTLLFSSGFYSLFRRAVPSRQLGILRYHAVCARDAGYAEPGICVTPAAFERHLDYFGRHYRVLPLPEAVRFLSQGKTLPTNAIAVTFDDGYADNFAAAQALARRGLSATFYLTAGCLADGAPFWPAELRQLIANVEGPELRLDTAGISVQLPLASTQDRRAAVGHLTKVFKGHPIPVREALREGLRSLSKSSQQASPMLGWDDVRAMHAMGMEIGSHTMTHPNLPNAGVDAARQEIVQSKARLQEEIGATVTMFSYPNGGAERYLTHAVASIVRDAGYVAATTSRNAFAGSSSDLFALERIQVSEDLATLVFALEIERFAFKPKPRPGELSPV